jgi:RNA polymerase sigma-70 factor (ECF subfamily)
VWPMMLDMDSPKLDVNESDLMRRTADGDVQAFDALYRRHRAQVLAVALRTTGRRVAAEEVTQDVFLGLWRAARSYDPSRGTLKSWLLSTTRNRSIDWLRREGRHDRNLELNDTMIGRLESTGRTDLELIRREQTREVRLILSGLPPKQRQVIGLAYLAELSNTEIASTMGIPLGTVKSRQRHALSRMRAELRPGGSSNNRSAHHMASLQ